MKLTLQTLLDAVPGSTLTTGTISDRAPVAGLFDATTERKVRWVAVKGDVNDWAIYCHGADKSEEWIKENGAKITDKKKIREIISCDDKMFASYRY